MLGRAGAQRHPGAKAELLPKQLASLYTCPFQQSSPLFQAVRVAHRVFKQFGWVLWIIIMSYSLPKPLTKCDSTHADLSDCGTHSAPQEYLQEAGDLLPKQGKKRKKSSQSSLLLAFPYACPPDTSYSLWKTHFKSQQCAPQQHICRLYQLIYCKDPFGLANTECKVTINVNYSTFISLSSLYLQVTTLTAAARSVHRSGRVCIHFAPCAYPRSFAAGLDFHSGLPEMAAPSAGSGDGIASFPLTGRIRAGRSPPAAGPSPLQGTSCSISPAQKKSASSSHHSNKTNFKNPPGWVVMLQEWGSRGTRNSVIPRSDAIS